MDDELTNKIAKAVAQELSAYETFVAKVVTVMTPDIFAEVVEKVDPDKLAKAMAKVMVEYASDKRLVARYSTAITNYAAIQKRAVNRATEIIAEQIAKETMGA